MHQALEMRPRFTRHRTRGQPLCRRAGDAGIWRELLGHDRFGPDEVFLAAGGDSLLAMRVLTRMRQLLGVDVALPDFLRAPTVAGLAEAVERERANHQRASDAELARLLDEIERGQ